MVSRSVTPAVWILALSLACTPACSASSDPAVAPGTGSGGSSQGSGGGGTGGATEPTATGGSVFVSPPFEADGDAGTALRARIQVAGNDGVCGACDVLLVQAQGGHAPYTYAWSDPSLIGPGPHTVCPITATHYSVVVTDTSRSSGTEISAPADSVSADADLTCVPTPPDAGAPPTDDGIDGCKVLTETEKVSCPDDGTATATSTRLEFTPTLGRAYQYTYDQLLPIGLGATSTVDVYLGMTPCDRAMKAFTITLDNLWTQSFCFTLDQQYTYSTAVIHVNGIPFTLGTVPTVCDSCTTVTPP